MSSGVVPKFSNSRHAVFRNAVPLFILGVSALMGFGAITQSAWGFPKSKVRSVSRPGSGKKATSSRSSRRLVRKPKFEPHPPFEGVTQSFVEGIGLTVTPLNLRINAESEGHRIANQILAKVKGMPDAEIGVINIVLNHLGSGKPNEMRAVAETVMRQLRDHPKLYAKIRFRYQWLDTEDLAQEIDNLVKVVRDTNVIETTLLTYRNDAEFGRTTPLTLKERLGEFAANVRALLNISGGLSYVGLFIFPPELRPEKADFIFTAINTFCTSWMMYHEYTSRNLSGGDYNAMLSAALNIGGSFALTLMLKGTSYFVGQAMRLSTKEAEKLNEKKGDELTPKESRTAFRESNKVMFITYLLHSEIFRLLTASGAGWTDNGFHPSSEDLKIAAISSAEGVPAKFPFARINKLLQGDADMEIALPFRGAGIWNTPVGKAIDWATQPFLQGISGSINHNRKLWTVGTRITTGLVLSLAQVGAQLGMPLGVTAIKWAGGIGLAFYIYERKERYTHSLERAGRAVMGDPGKPLNCYSVFEVSIEPPPGPGQAP